MRVFLQMGNGMFSSAATVSSGMPLVLAILLGLGMCFMGYRHDRLVSLGGMLHFGILTGLCLSGIFVRELWINWLCGGILGLVLGILGYKIPAAGFALWGVFVAYDIIEEFTSFGAWYWYSLLVVTAAVIFFACRKRRRIPVSIITSLLGATMTMMALIRIGGIPYQPLLVVIWLSASGVLALLGLITQTLIKKNAIVQI